MAIGNLKLSPIPARMQPADGVAAAGFSIDVINRFKSIQLQVADLQAQLDVYGDFLGLATGAPSSIMPDDPAIIGVSPLAARQDHQHAIVAAAPSQGIGGSNAEGAAASFARSDHDHTLRETSGPTNLPIGAILNGEIPWRQGASLVGRHLESSRTLGTATTSSTTLSDVSANVTYALKADTGNVVIWAVYYNTAATTTGIRLSVNYTGTLASIRYGIIGATSLTGFQSETATVVDTPLGQAGVGPGGTTRLTLMWCFIRTTTAGDIALRYASGVAASNVSIGTGSHGIVLQTL